MYICFPILLVFLNIKFLQSEQRIRRPIRQISNNGLNDIVHENVKLQLRDILSSFKSSVHDIDDVIDEIMEILPNVLSEMSFKEIGSNGDNVFHKKTELEQRSNRKLLVQSPGIHSKRQWISLLMTLVCVCCAACAAGLTLGLLSLDPLDLELKIKAGTENEQKRASLILPLLNNDSHRLLVTLLLFNSVANEAMPCFLNNLVPEYMAVIISVTLVLLFGEILPSAIFTGKKKLAIVSKCAWLVKFLLVIFYVFAWPLAWLLDRLLGHKSMKKYTRDELLHLVELHHRAEIISREQLNCEEELQMLELRNLSMFESFTSYGERTPLFESKGLRRSCLIGREYGLTQDEVDIMTGAIKSMKAKANDILVPLKNVFSLSINQKMDFDTMAAIMASGYSRVLVYQGEDPSNIRGFLLVKKLIILDPEDARPIQEEWLKTPICVGPKMPVLELLNKFQEGNSHIALVSHAPLHTETELRLGQPLKDASRPIGIVTLEDIIETIIQEEVMDETSMSEKKANQIMKDYIRKQQDKKRREKNCIYIDDF